LWVVGGTTLNLLFIYYFIFYSIHLLFSPDAREKPRLFLASFGKAAGIAIAENARAIRFK
jgi:hypothetical protein